ncbi:hypothetical protein ACOTVD_06905 [Campylobacter jejuni]
MGAHDEYKYVNNVAMKQDLSKETQSFRNSDDKMALPMRKITILLMWEIM